MKSLSPSLVKIFDADLILRGTGFIIDDAGSVLTCHHVVDGLAEVRLEGHGGTPATADRQQVTMAPDVDLAMISGFLPCLGPPLPIAPSAAPSLCDYRTEGFHRYGEEFRSSFPASGRVTGTTSVRYTTERSDYEIIDALVLRDDEFGEGLSGAPVVEDSTGVVIGVVSTKLRSGTRAGGLGVPLSVDRAPVALAEALKRNLLVAPAFGPFLNIAAARALTRAQVADAVRGLTELRNVDLDRHIERTFTQHLDDAVSSGSPVVALVGPSGTGKSTELCALAVRSPRPVVLLRGSSVQASTKHIGEAIEQDLRVAVPDGRSLDAGLLAKVAATDGGLVVIMDALNEMSDNSGHGFEDWLVRSREWLRRGGAQLVVSSRPELWDQFAQRLSGQNNSDMAEIHIGEFDMREAAAAASQYGLAVGSAIGALKLPVVMRLAAGLDLRSAGAPAPASVNVLIARYVRDVAYRIASRIKGVSTGTVVDWLRTAAGRMLEASVSEIDIETFRSVFPEAVLAGDIVIDENLMSRTERGVRFVYNDVADWLKSGHIAIDDELTQQSLIAMYPAGLDRIGPMGYALREIEAVDGVEALIERLDRVVSSVEQVGLPAGALLEATVTKLTDVTPYLRVLHDFSVAASTTTRPWWTRGGERRLGFVTTTGFWDHLPASVTERLSLMQPLVASEHYYGWRPKDWDRLDIEDSAHNFATLALDVVRRDPDSGVPALLGWLPDTSPLRDDEATVSDVAQGIIYRLRHDAPAIIAAVIVEHHDALHEVLYRLGRSDQAFLFKVFASYAGHVGRARALLHISYQLDIAKLDAADRLLVADVLRSVRAEVDDSPLRWRATIQLASATGDAACVAEILDAFVHGQTDVDAYTVAAVAHWDPEAALAALRRVMRDQPDRDRELLGATSSLWEAGVQDQWDAEVARLASTGQLHPSYELGRYVDDRLQRLEHLTPAVEALARFIIHGPPAIAWQLSYALASAGSIRFDPTARARLARELLATEGEVPALNRFIGQLAQSGDYFDILAETLHQMDPDTADNTLFAAAIMNDGFAATLVSWISDGRLSPPGPRVQRMVAAADAGEDPRDAVRAILDEELGR